MKNRFKKRQNITLLAFYSCRSARILNFSAEHKGEFRNFVPNFEL